LNTDDIEKAEEVGRRLHQTILEKAENKRITNLINVLRGQRLRLTKGNRYSSARHMRIWRDNRVQENS